MQIVIDIPEEVCKRMKNGDLPIYMAYKYVKNGTPLDEFLYNGKSIREWMQIIASEDAISRQAVLDLIEHYNSDGLGSVFYGYEEGVKFADEVNKLQPVTPQPKEGET